MTMTFSKFVDMVNIKKNFNKPNCAIALLNAAVKGGGNLSFISDIDRVNNWLKSDFKGNLYNLVFRKEDAQNEYHEFDDVQFLDFIKTRLGTLAEIRNSFANDYSIVKEYSDEDLSLFIEYQFVDIVGIPPSASSFEEYRNKVQDGRYQRIMNELDEQKETLAIIMDSQEVVSKKLDSYKKETFDEAIEGLARLNAMMLDRKTDGILAQLPSIGITSHPSTHASSVIIFENGSYSGGYMIDEKTGQAIPHGQGKYTWSDESSYSGEYIQGVRCGRGTLTTADGRIIEAEWRDNNICGSVKATTELGIYYGYKDGNDSRTNKIVFNSGWVFEGHMDSDTVEGALFHPDKRYGRFFCSKEHGPIIHSGDEDIRRKIASFPHLLGKRIIYDDGRVYEGEMSGETPHGYGQVIFPNEMTLVVKYDMGEICGNRGVWTFPVDIAGNRNLECVWKDSQWQGACIINGITAVITLTFDGYVTSVKGVYEDGSWEELVECTDDGFVRVMYSSGAEYRGDRAWLDGIGYAKGIYVDPEGIMHDGEWVDGKQNGKFITTFSEGMVGSASYVDGIPVGAFILTFDSGVNFESEWKDGKLAFDCVKITFPDKSAYQGECCESTCLPNGQGTLVLANGEIYSGKWDKGHFDDDGRCIDVSSLLISCK